MNKPLIIGIGATHSGAGKTTIAKIILEYYTNSSVNTHFPHGTGWRNTYRKWGAIKYTKTDSPPSIVSDKKILMKKNKDTWKMTKAGASEVLWVKSHPSSLNMVIPAALKKLLYLDGIIVEGNSAIEFLKPDVVIFILGENKQRWKSGLEKLIAAAAIILYENKTLLPKITITKKVFSGKLSDKNSFKRIIELISGLFMKKELKEEIIKKTVNGKLSCAAARKIAENLSVSYKKVGAAADELGIKIKDCQLGCF